jgi:hypothetical protein
MYSELFYFVMDFPFWNGACVTQNKKKDRYPIHSLATKRQHNSVFISPESLLLIKHETNRFILFF